MSELYRKIRDVQEDVKRLKAIQEKYKHGDILDVPWEDIKSVPMWTLYTLGPEDGIHCVRIPSDRDDCVYFWRHMEPGSSTGWHLHSDTKETVWIQRGSIDGLGDHKYAEWHQGYPHNISSATGCILFIEFLYTGYQDLYAPQPTLF